MTSAPTVTGVVHRLPPPEPAVLRSPDALIKVDLDERCFLFPTAKNVSHLQFMVYRGDKLRLELAYPYNVSQTPTELLEFSPAAVAEFSRKLGQLVSLHCRRPEYCRGHPRQWLQPADWHLCPPARTFHQHGLHLARLRGSVPHHRLPVVTRIALSKARQWRGRWWERHSGSRRGGLGFRLTCGCGRADCAGCGHRRTVRGRARRSPRPPAI
jgi:hypothetical protein